MKIPGIMSSLTALAWTLWALSAPVLGAEVKHFRFSVPVHIENMPHTIGGLSLGCIVSNQPDPSDSSFTSVNSIGGRRVPPILLDSSGSYHGRIDVSFNATPGKDPALGKTYRCDISYQDRGSIDENGMDIMRRLNNPQSPEYMKEFDPHYYRIYIYKVVGFIGPPPIRRRK